MHPEPPKIEFPSTDYPIKVVGEAHDGFKVDVLSVLSQLEVTLTSEHVREAASSRGRYVSLTIFITAESEQQLKDINTELRALPAVKTVL